MSTPAPTDQPADAGAAKAPDAGAGPAGTAEEERALPPSMTPNLPGIDGLSEEEIASFMESLDEFTPTVRSRPRDQPPTHLPPPPTRVVLARPKRSITTLTEESTPPLSLPHQIPDALTNHYLKRAGINEPDVRITRLISLATQKFISQIADDARQCATRRSEMSAKEKRERGIDPKDKRVVLTMEDLSAALGEYGVNVRKPPYFAGAADADQGDKKGAAGRR